jgi:hypothetical protein
MAKRNCISSLLCAAVFGYFLYQCGFLKVSAAYWPKLICTAGLVLSILECVIDAFKWMKERGEQKSLMPLTFHQAKRFSMAVIFMVLWILGLKTIGFLVSSVIAMSVISCVFEIAKDRRHMLRNVVVSAAVGVLFYAVFSYLGIHFPRTLLI